MIETTIPEIDINQLMARVRAEAAKPRPVLPRPSPAATAAPRLPPVALLPAAPTVWIPSAVKSIKQRLDRVIETAREKNDGGSGLPKFLRRFFRKQGGYNRAVIDGVAALAKSNQELTQRVSDITVCLSQLNSWLLALHEQSDGDANWMKAAAPGLMKIAAVEGEVASIGHEMRAGQSTLQELWREQSGVRDKMEAVESSVTEQFSALRQTVDRIRQETADEVAAKLEEEWDERSRGFRSELDLIATHLRNLQAQADGISQHLAELKDDTEKRAAGREEKHDHLQHQVDHAGLHLRNLQAQTDQLGIHVSNLQAFADRQPDLIQRIGASEERALSDAALVKGELAEYGVLFRRLFSEHLGHTSGTGRKKAAQSNPQTKSSPGLDPFYLAFENRFRGPRSEIKRRVEFYLPFIRKSHAGSSGRPILDVGCGRGEWLELLRENDLEGHGVDMNTAMVSQCNALNLKVRLGDAIDYLGSLRANSHGAVTGFHIIEHLPFETLLELFRQARRVLKPGGVAIFESPNCKNLAVGACNFHIDPTHQHPVYPDTAELMLSSQGFEKVRIEYLSPVLGVEFDSSTPELAKIKDLLYGPQDFGIIAYKPAG